MLLPRLKELREDHALTQQQIADILGCKREVYRRYETGIRSIPIEMAIQLADYYEISLDVLVGRKER